MVALQCSFQSMRAATVPFYKPHPLLQQSRTVLKRDVLNLSKNRKDGSSVPSRSYSPLESFERVKNSSHVCWSSAADPPSSPDSSIPAAAADAADAAEPQSVPGVEVPPPYASHLSEIMI